MSGEESTVDEKIEDSILDIEQSQSFKSPDLVASSKHETSELDSITVNDSSQKELQSEIDSPSVQNISSDIEPQKKSNEKEKCADSKDNSPPHQSTPVKISEVNLQDSSPEKIELISEEEETPEKKSSKRDHLDLQDSSVITDDEDESPDKKKQKLVDESELQIYQQYLKNKKQGNEDEEDDDEYQDLDDTDENLLEEVQAKSKENAITLSSDDDDYYDEAGSDEAEMEEAESDDGEDLEDESEKEDDDIEEIADEQENDEVESQNESDSENDSENDNDDAKTSFLNEMRKEIKQRLESRLKKSSFIRKTALKKLKFAKLRVEKSPKQNKSSRGESSTSASAKQMVIQETGNSGVVKPTCPKQGSEIVDSVTPEVEIKNNETDKSSVTNENEQEKKAEEAEKNEISVMSVDDEAEPQIERVETEIVDSKTDQSNPTIEEVRNASIDTLFKKYNHLDKFKDTLEAHLETTRLEIHRFEQLWNEKLRIRMKIEECLHRIDRRNFIKQEKFNEPANEERPIASNANPEEKSDQPEELENSRTQQNQNSSINKVDPVINNFNFDFNLECEKVLKRAREISERQPLSRFSLLGNLDESGSKLLPLTSSPSNNGTNNNSNNNNNNNNSSYLIQGRQGPIIDVQSIIADFRQKNPQDIPRRGRRLKNVGDLQSQLHGHSLQQSATSPFNGNSFSAKNQSSENGNNSNNTPINAAELQELLAKAHGSSMNFHPALAAVSNQESLRNQKLPEISLYPVHNFYNNTPTTSTSAAGTSPGSASNSLLHGILTKDFKAQQSKPQVYSPTLARLLTAPERGMGGIKPQMGAVTNNQSKVHSNGEITITPIAVGGHGAQKLDFNAMDDDDNSIDRLVIDEGEEDVQTKQRGQKTDGLVCQGCRKKPANFLCAGCNGQWYCSRECQIQAWDIHSEECNP